MSHFETVAPDESRAREILAEYFGYRDEQFPVPGGYVKSFPDPAEYQNGAGAFVLLVDTAIAIGCGGVRNVPAGAIGIRFEVKCMFVTPTFQGQGFGLALLTELERRAIGLGAVELVLDTHDSLVAAGALYSRFGFNQIESYNDNRNATRWYSKELTKKN